MKILFLARLDEFKDPITFCKAAELLPQHRFYLAGNGPLMEDCKKLGAPNLEILGWVADPKPVLEEADIFCQLSPYENIWADSLMQAMAAGKVIIATDVGFTKEFIGNVAILIPPRDFKSLAKAILKLEDNEFRGQYANMAADYAHNNLMADKIAKQFADILER